MTSFPEVVFESQISVATVHQVHGVHSAELSKTIVHQHR